MRPGAGSKDPAYVCQKQCMFFQMKRSAIAPILLVVLLLAIPAGAQQWPQFRGTSSGIAADDPRLPETWSATDNVAWKRSFVAAFDARTGNELWRTDREGEKSNWSTPFVWRNDLRTEIVTTGSRKARSYDTSGKLLWELSGLSSIHAITPFASHGLLFVSSGYFQDAVRPTYAIRPGAAGDISLKGEERSNSFVVWSNPTLASAYPSPLVVGDQYYTLMDRGILTSNDPKTGKEIYGRQRIAPDSGTFSASPWAYNGRIFAVSEEGETFVMQAGPEFKLLGRNPLGEMTLASPAVANGSVFIRTATKLYRIARR